MGYQKKDVKIEGKTVKCWLGLTLKSVDADTYSDTDTTDDSEKSDNIWSGGDEKATHSSKAVKLLTK